MFMVIDRSLQMELVAGDRGGLHAKDGGGSTAICHCLLDICSDGVAKCCAISRNCRTRPTQSSNENEKKRSN